MKASKDLIQINLTSANSYIPGNSHDAPLFVLKEGISVLKEPTVKFHTVKSLI